MKILYVCHRFPFPPKSGSKIRAFNMIRHLSERHEVTVCSLARSQDEAQEGRGITPHCHRYEMALVSNPVQTLRMVARLPTAMPSSMGYFYSHDLARRIRRLVAQQRFDLIFVHCSSVAQYVEGINGIPKILDFCDMDSQKWLEYVAYKPFPLKAGFWLEGRKMEREEKRLARRFDFCTTATPAEWETLESYGTGVAADWFPIGVDADFFQPDGQGYDADTISFVGRMDYYPNQEAMFRFCDQVWPLLRQRRPGMKLLIVGADPTPEVCRLGELPGVTVTGSVPDVRPYILSSAATVAPLNIARGTQNKILEAMAMGVPVVSSRIAAGGVDALADEHFLVADTPLQYADAIARLAGDPVERERLARAGRDRMLSHHAWTQSMQRLDAIIERCLSAFQRDQEHAS
ncbi:MAG: hypothetical protein RJA36_3210 [Pseudomonadota bacterium]|jgi:sugar transferase (PEP-CTERM/EpsH1 system associated)